MAELRFTVPGTPPSVNHYVRHLRSGVHYTTPAAHQFKESIALCANGNYVTGNAFGFEVHISAYFGTGRMPDVDNIAKVTMDGLAKAGCFRNVMGVPMSDAHVLRLVLEKAKDKENPRTEIVVRAING